MFQPKAHTKYLCRLAECLGKGIDPFKIEITNMTTDRMGVKFLSPQPHGIGYYKWWFIEEFVNIYELIEEIS